MTHTRPSSALRAKNKPVRKQSNPRTEYVIRCITDVHDVLRAEKDLSPRNARVNSALTNLVSCLTQSYDPLEECSILGDTRIAGIRQDLLTYLSRAEAEMEKYWADYLCHKDKITAQDLTEFWYWKNYEDLVTAELSMLPRMENKPDKGIAFVGAGPLPLSAIIMHQKTGMPVTCIDNDPVACAKAQKLVDKMGLTNNIRVVCSDGADIHYKDHPVVFIASLVPNKDAVIRQIRSGQEGCHIGIRSAERLHILLYEPIEKDMGEKMGLDFVTQTAHKPETINTTLFYFSDPTRSIYRGQKIRGLKTASYGWGNHKP